MKCIFFPFKYADCRRINPARNIEKDTTTTSGVLTTLTSKVKEFVTNAALSEGRAYD
jgi:hypothetical protein